MSIFLLAAIVAIFLPTALLMLTWKNVALKKQLTLYLLFQALQITTEKGLALNGRRDLIKYTAIVFVSLRLLHLLWALKLRSALAALPMALKRTCFAVYVPNLILWAYVWFRLLNKILAVKLGS